MVFVLTFIGPCIVIHIFSKSNYMHQCIKFILFWNDTLHVSDGLPVHHHEFKTVHTVTGIWQTDTAYSLLARLYSSICLTVAVCTKLNSWWWKKRPSETCRVSFQSEIKINLYTMVHLFYFAIEIILRSTALWMSKMKIACFCSININSRTPF